MSTVTRSIAIFTLVGLFLQTNCVLVCYGLFFLNQKAIAESACEKKTLDCCGRCFLHKQIASSTDTKPASAEKQLPTKTLEQLLSAMPGLVTNMQHPLLTTNTAHSFTSAPPSFILDGVLRKIDHPPNA
jgi:hypothetical protein